MAQSVFDIVKAPLGWSIFADNVKIGGIYGSKEAALEAAALAASFAVSEGAGVQINVPGLPEEKIHYLVQHFRHGRRKTFRQIRLAYPPDWRCRRYVSFVAKLLNACDCFLKLIKLSYDARLLIRRRQRNIDFMKALERKYSIATSRTRAQSANLIEAFVCT